MKIVAIIPARFDSSRFPGKPLVDILGKTMIQRVYEQAIKQTKLHDVIIATDDERILNHARSFGASVYMTSKDHPSGTDRVAELAQKLKSVDAIINIQGDEPFIDPDQIGELYHLISKPEVQIATLASKLTKQAEIQDSNIVKVCFDENFIAVNFSRDPKNMIHTKSSTKTYYKHLGIYAYKSNILSQLTELEQSELEKKERLEQLRWMENGFEIKIAISKMPSPSIDTPEDLEKLLKNDYFLNK